jgi:hypothetical protein
VTDNATGLNQSGACTLESLKNSLVRGNTTNTAGTITDISPGL